MQNHLGILAARLEQISATLDRMDARPASDGSGGQGCASCGYAQQAPVAEGEGSAAQHGARALQPPVTAGADPALRTPPPGARNATAIALAEAVLRSRERRSSFLEGDLLFDPVWAMLLDIFCATLRGKQLSVSAVLIGSGVPDTTALRYLRVLEERGYVARVADETDRRRSFVKMSVHTFEGMMDYFAALEEDTTAILPPKMAHA